MKSEAKGRNSQKNNMARSILLRRPTVFSRNSKDQIVPNDVINQRTPGGLGRTPTPEGLISAPP